MGRVPSSPKSTWVPPSPETATSLARSQNYTFVKGGGEAVAGGVQKQVLRRLHACHVLE